MAGGGGFYTLEQEENFAIARALTQRGGPDAPICGARTRTGSRCQAVPITGSRRCIRHCGPKAAGEHRERQRAAFLRGAISAAEWREAEVKRARNRLRETWKKNPWLPGRTIDLGPHEITFAAAIPARPIAGSELTPAIIDWLRWRYRRLQIDRRDDGAWQRILVGELQTRILAAGPAPQDWTPDMNVPDTTIAVRLVASGDCPAPFSKRLMPDAPKAERVRRARKVRGRGRPRSAPLTDDEAQAIARTCAEYHSLLAPLLDRCASQGERDAVIRALHEYLHNPDNGSMAARWLTIVRELGVGPISPAA